MTTLNIKKAVYEVTEEQTPLLFQNKLLKPKPFFHGEAVNYKISLRYKQEVVSWSSEDLLLPGRHFKRRCR